MERTIGQIANAVRVAKGERPLFCDMTRSERAAEVDRLLVHFAPDNDGVNLDCEVDPHDLWQLWSAISRHERVIGRRLFPSKPSGYVRATSMLGNYAANKATAMQCRERGDIQAASVYETICEGIYDRLPEYARW